MQLGQGTTVRLAAPASLILFSERSIARQQLFATGATYRYALVDIDPSLVRDEIGIDPGTLCRAGTEGFGFKVRPASDVERALASQILASPIGRMHNLLRLAKALELTAVMVDSLRPRGRTEKTSRLTATEIERVHEARSLLARSIADAPDQTTLAAEIGLNPRRLALGFRAVFGTTPYAFLQEERLQEGYRRLAAGASSVSEVSYAVGYSPAHFATLFGRRFGIPPSNLLAGRARPSTTGSSFEEG